jgi:LDH2 family malate/lactate/ureidoglycolate dehydrogenase
MAGSVSPLGKLEENEHMKTTDPKDCLHDDPGPDFNDYLP